MNQDERPMEWREFRRRRGWELKKQGWKQKDIAIALGVSKGAVSQWMSRAEKQGVEALRRHPAPGARPKLTAEQHRQLPDLLAHGAEAFGFRGQVWTTQRVAEVIQRTFGVKYHPAHCSRLLRALKQSVQKPVQRAIQRDEAAIQRWKQERWSALKKKAQQERRTIVFIDEAGFYLLPMAVRTYAPCGQTPVLPVKLTRDHLSAIGALTQKGRLFMQTQDHAYCSEDVVRFLRLLLRRISGKLLVIWDGATIHRSQVIKDFLARGAAKRIHLERLPGYAPELNPQEGVWNLLKRRELKNVCCRDVPQVAQELRRAKERLRHRPAVLRQCFAHAGYLV